MADSADRFDATIPLSARAILREAAYDVDLTISFSLSAKEILVALTIRDAAHPFAAAHLLGDVVDAQMVRGSQLVPAVRTADSKGESLGFSFDRKAVWDVIAELIGRTFITPECGRRWRTEVDAVDFTPAPT